MAKRVLFGTVVALVAMAAVPAEGFAFECPAVAVEASITKATVCAAPRLRGLNKSEQARLKSLNGRLRLDRDRARVREDRTRFNAAREACGKTQRCLEGAYRSQIRLYDQLDICAARGGPATKCLDRTITRHRREIAAGR
jgi:uncharacterized protein